MTDPKDRVWPTIAAMYSGCDRFVSERDRAYQKKLDDCCNLWLDSCFRLLTDAAAGKRERKSVRVSAPECAYGLLRVSQQRVISALNEVYRKDSGNITITEQNCLNATGSETLYAIVLDWSCPL